MESLAKVTILSQALFLLDGNMILHFTSRSAYEDTPCEDCGQMLSTVTTILPGNGFNETQLVREERMSHLMWEEALASDDLAPDYKASNVCVYCSKGHLVSISKVKYE